MRQILVRTVVATMAATMVATMVAACGDDRQPQPDAGGVTVSHPGNPPPITCAPGWYPDGDGCVPACSAASSIPCYCGGAICPTASTAESCVARSLGC